MEIKINIAAILKDKPQGTKLYDWLHNIDVEFDNVETTEIETSIWCTRDKGGYNELFGYSKLGTLRGWLDGLQILLPSKKMRDWRKFAWKKGDVLVSNDGDSHIIFKGFSKNDYTTFEGKHWISVSKKRHISCLEMRNVQDYHIEDNKDSSQTYINTLEKRLGGKLNLETLEIEKQLEFKDGDIVVYGKSVAICRKIYKHTLCFYVSLNEMFGLLFDDEVESSEEYRFATEEEKKQFFSALEKEGKRWDSDKKAIVDLKPKVELKPFDKVLVRDFGSQAWQVSLFGYKDSDFYYCCNGCGWNQCIPYNEETAHLLGTTGEWKGGEG
jgi:hypothetical protein